MGTASSAGARVAIVTGGSGGIGGATARLLASSGWRVFAAARRPGRIPGEDGIVALPLDLTDGASVVAAVALVCRRAGRIDALVNAAGYAEAGPLELMAPELVERQFATCALGPLRLAQLVLPVMRDGGGGRIVNLGTVMARAPFPLLGLYGASKAAEEALAEALRLESRWFGVRVVTVVPGSVRSGFDDATVERLRRLERGMPGDGPYAGGIQRLGRLLESAGTRAASPESVAKVIRRALETSRPRRRYAATPAGRLLALLPRLPAPLRDRVRTRPLGL